ncbi:MAG: FAD-dependent monooxygenase [Hymenobacter sp.]|nr:MAG: FAD-dependent monooxygenase [Hymenobacter sp.]
MQRSLLQNKQVAIIGGGPVGLLLAVLLQQRGASVKVYERDAGPEARISGGTLDIHLDLGQPALAAAGLLEAFYQLARPTAMRLADERGQVLLEEPVDEATAYDRPEIDRADLRCLLLSGLAAGTVEWGQHFQALEKLPGNRFLLRFAGQPDQVADVVVGANGGRSRVRPYVTDTVPEYTGSFIIQGQIPAGAAKQLAFGALVSQGNLLARAEGKMLFVHTRADGTLNYYVSFRQPADWLSQRGLPADQPAQVVALLAEELSGWAPLYHEAFQATTEFALLPMHRLPPTPNRLVTEAITLIGDAAHVMPPFAGVGVNIGLLDALHLADNLTKGQFATVEAAIEAYERTMCDYASQAQAGTAQAELDMHSDLGTVELMAANHPD